MVTFLGFLHRICGLFKTALLQSIENHSENIRQPQHTDDIRLLGDQQRLIMSQKKLIDGLVSVAFA
jgi:hypothetical protein